ncbi:glutathione S-transferase family protein [Phyllobacterium myrsinacearum]|uniref:Glutathione S-transferase n=1 Tax=Phyllobacterium myrsinacearum TaxID=28101 RepID=A0A839ELJ2_9HYPH|nr:glutathione S-transferase [Phyllobacterium myrsinacearum]MBA8880921.1 glutathione S-transferase [Phyllobacterium myrsinacearum]
MQLHYHPLSGHSHRVLLFLSLISADHELVLVDIKSAEHKSDAFLALNPFGQIPVLVDNQNVVADSNAILVYLAKKFGRTDWLPEDALGAARIQRWLSVAAGQIAFGPAAARLITLFNAPFRPEEVIGRAHAILKLIDFELALHNWIAADRPTIADVALYSYVARAPEGNIDLTVYGAIQAWLQRMEALPNFIPFVETPLTTRA